MGFPPLPSASAAGSPVCWDQDFTVWGFPGVLHIYYNNNAVRLTPRSAYRGQRSWSDYMWVGGLYRVGSELGTTCPDRNPD